MGFGDPQPGADTRGDGEGTLVTADHVQAKWRPHMPQLIEGALVSRGGWVAGQEWLSHWPSTGETIQKYVTGADC